MKVEVERLDGKHLEVRARGLAVDIDELEEAGGSGQGFRPTELLLGALGACMAGTMLTFAANESIPVDEVVVRLEDEVAPRPKRIDRIRVEMTVGGDLSERQAASLRRVASACKIHNTLTAGVSVEVAFEAGS